MTWSVTNTITYTGTASNHTAMVYLFDTVLAGKTGWTIQAHPDGSAFKRRAKFTTANKTTGTNYTIYSWVTWSSVTPSSVTWYEDATYTTTPGDLATSTNNFIDSSALNIGWTTAGESWRFCESSENSQSVLVLKGNKVVFYWPGITSGVFWQDSTWIAGQSNKGTWVCPYIGTRSLWAANSPLNTGTNANEYSLVPDAGFSYNASAGGYRMGGNCIATNFNWLYTTTQNGPTPDISSHVAFANGGHNDVGVWLPATVGNDGIARAPFSEIPGITLQVGSDYWFNAVANLSFQGLVFNFGAVDPFV